MIAFVREQRLHGRMLLPSAGAPPNYVQLLQVGACSCSSTVMSVWRLRRASCDLPISCLEMFEVRFFMGLCSISDCSVREHIFYLFHRLYNISHLCIPGTGDYDRIFPNQLIWLLHAHISLLGPVDYRALCSFLLSFMHAHIRQ